MGPGILHIDMDAFYASVEVLDDPSLAGKPVIVGGRPGSRGVVSAASYEAREFGVRSAMPLVRAERLCPDGVFQPVRMARYVAISSSIFSIFRDYTPLVEGLSLDEAFLDVRASERLFGTGPEIGRQIRARIEAELGLPCSVGVAPVKFVAKIASDLEKPNGFVVVQPGQVRAFLARLPIERLWGVGEVTAEKLRHFGITRIGQIRTAGAAFLTEHLGEVGAHLSRLSMGEDGRRVIPDSGRKSVGHETTFPEDIDDPVTLHGILLDVAEEVARRARAGDHLGRTITLKIRYAPFETHTAQTSLGAPTNTTAEIYAAARRLFDQHIRVPPRKVRLLGISISGLARSSDRQLGLFSEADRSRAVRLDRTMDRIVERLGRRSIRRAGTMRPRKEEGDQSG